MSSTSNQVESGQAAQWDAVRKQLKEALLAGEIPLDSTLLRPKGVFTKYKDSPAFATFVYDKKTREKFTRMLASLRKKHQNGDLANENAPKRIEWAKSAAKQYLKKCFREKTIPVDYADAEQVWSDHCKDKPAFARMACDDAFKRRLATVRDDYFKKAERCKADLAAYKAAKENHPTPLLNRRGEPQWNGSEAQKLLKEIVSRGEQIGVRPSKLREKYEVFQAYSKQTFRDHIYQEQRLVKFNKWCETLKKARLDSLQY